MAQTFVAIEPNGLDPCDLRLRSGEKAVLDLVAQRIPLVEFVLRSTVARHDLDTAEGRVAAMNAGIPHVARIKDRALRDEYARRLAGLIGFGLEDQVLARVRGLERADERRTAPLAAQPAVERKPAVEVDEAVAAVEREVLKVALQLPGVAGPEFDALPPEAFLVDRYREVCSAIAAAGGAASGVTGPAWAEKVSSYLTDERIRRGVSALSVEPLRLRRNDQPEPYAAAVLARMHEIVLNRQIAAVKSRLQRINPQERPDDHARMFGELAALEGLRRNFRERAIGGQ